MIDRVDHTKPIRDQPKRGGFRLRLCRRHRQPEGPPYRLRRKFGASRCEAAALSAGSGHHRERTLGT